MDILADELAQARARGAVFSVLRRVAPWGLAFEGRRPLTAHILVEGEGWLEQQGSEPLRIRQRDVVLVTAGAPYAIVSAPGAATVPIAEARHAGDQQQDAPGAGATILCGAYVLEGSVAAPLLRSLPRLVIVPAQEQQPSHAAAIALLEAEARGTAPGQQTLLDRLLDLNLVYALRSWWSTADSHAPGWFRALSDLRLRRVLEHVHTDPGQDWSVPAMAAAAGMSRAAFSARFTEVVGRPPARYLTERRMNRAQDALERTDATLAHIARDVGYRNEFAFATAFRRHHGLPPGQWRTRSRMAT